MSVTAQEISPAAFKQRVAGTQFASAVCIVYGGTGDNCIIYEVSCSNTSEQSVMCPMTGEDNIQVLTSYDTQQIILNPGFLHAPSGTNQWTNIFNIFFQQRIDPTTGGLTRGFSDFVAVDLGVPLGPPVVVPPGPPIGSGGCIQDCGFPGNGGVNSGRDKKKPPFPGKGRKG
jgi:hypothetical protein